VLASVVAAMPAMAGSEPVTVAPVEGKPVPASHGNSGFNPPGIPFKESNFRRNQFDSGTSTADGLPFSEELSPMGKAKSRPSGEPRDVIIKTVPIVKTEVIHRGANTGDQVTVSPFLQWVSRYEDIDSIIKEAEKNYPANTNRAARVDDPFLKIRFPYLGAEPAPTSGNAVIYSTPTQ